MPVPDPRFAWVRIVGTIIQAVGAVAVAAFLLAAFFGGSLWGVDKEGLVSVPPGMGNLSDILNYMGIGGFVMNLVGLWLRSVGERH